MARFSKIEVLLKMTSTGMVPVFYDKDPATACNVLRACYKGGVKAFEFTNRGDFAHEVFSELVRFARRECPDMAVGTGSVIDAPTAALYMQLGADFIVGPMFNRDVAEVCNRRLVPYSPGCGTVTEIAQAQTAGCDLCKIFPAGSVGGPEFVKNVKAPMPWSMIMATGAVEPTQENLSAWFRRGTDVVGMGSKLFPEEVIAAEDWDRISEKCRLSLEIIAKNKK